MTKFAGLLAGFLLAASAQGASMVINGLTGDVTQAEKDAFIAYIQANNFPGADNTGNDYVYGYEGQSLHAQALYYKFEPDVRVLNRMIACADKMLSTRNDPNTGVILWTGKRELTWPNHLPTLYTGTENGDICEHIVSVALAILNNKSVQNLTAPTDTYGYGTTYLDRAKTYIRECDKTYQTFMIPSYIRTDGTYRQYHPDSQAYRDAGGASGAIPWNQQSMINGGLFRLAQCHQILGDNPAYVAQYQAILRATPDWFFNNHVTTSTVSGHTVHSWAYVSGRNPTTQPEDTGHSFYDAYVVRNYEQNLNCSAAQIQSLIDTCLYVMNTAPNSYSGYVNGNSDTGNPARSHMDYQWMELGVFDYNFYLNQGQSLIDKGDYKSHAAQTAAILYTKHYWATHAFTGYYKIISRNSGKAAVVQSASTADSAPVIQYSYTAAAPANDEWQFVSVGGQFFKIINRNSGKALVVQSASTADNALVIQYPYGGANTNDEWSIEDSSPGYFKIVNRNSGKVLNIAGASLSNGATINQYRWAQVPQQEWAIQAVP